MKKTFLTLFLCACILLSGSVRPYFCYADDEEPTFEDEAFTEDTSGDEVVDEENVSPNAVEEKYQDQIDSLSERLKALEEEKKELDSQINNTKSEKERALATKNALDAQISITREEIATFLERIDLLEQNIGDKQESINLKRRDINNKQSEIDDNYEILRKRLRSKYMQDTTTTLGLIVGADSFSDLLTRIEYIRRIAQHDRALLETLTNQRVALEQEKVGLEYDMAVLEGIKQDVEADKLESENKKEVLNVQVSKAQMQVQDLAEMERAFLADLERNKKIQDEAKAELDRILREIEWSKNAYAGGVMAWPLPDYIPGRGLTVTSEFGPRFNNADYHTGIDLSGTGVFGHNIVAANSGTVVIANTAVTQGRGYGKYVVIDHGVDDNGKSVSTVYAHCSSLSVSVGQTVSKGQAIAQVGSTGWSTGPHLHFEVRLNGTAVPPRPYIFG